MSDLFKLDCFIVYSQTMHENLKRHDINCVNQNNAQRNIFRRYYSSGNKQTLQSSEQKTTNCLPEGSKESGNWLQGHLSSLYKAKAPRTFTVTLIYKDFLTVRESWKAIYTDFHSDKATDCCLLIISGLDREQRPSFEHVSCRQPLYRIWRKWVMTSCARFIAERSHLQR